MVCESGVPQVKNTINAKPDNIMPLGQDLLNLPRWPRTPIITVSVEELRSFVHEMANSVRAEYCSVGR